MSAATSARCPHTGRPVLQHPCQGKPGPRVKEVLASWGLCLLLTPCPSPTAGEEAPEPAGPWGDTKQPGFVPGLCPPLQLDTKTAKTGHFCTEPVQKSSMV